MNQDDEHLRVLAICHFVMAGITGLFSLFPIFHLIMGLAMLSGAWDPNDMVPPNAPPGFEAPQMPEAVGWLLVIFPLVIILGGLTFAVVLAFAGRSLQKRRGWLFCMIVAGISCAFMPFGTVLGVFTLVVLLRESVKELFGHPSAIDFASD